ncbi:MAG: DUF3800 domain-containing protein [Candidatus Berkelbacteria bacterium]|nr:DUF3800 domain-containing protein [Candidatus Berkelbacteria bacterium]
MLVFIDDSGDPGFKVGKGSSCAFVICCVIFDDELEAEKTAVCIKELKRELKKNDKYEFKFNKSSKGYRLKFLSAIKKFNFRIRAIIMTKEVIYSDELKNNKTSFYNYTIKTVLKHSSGKIKNAKIRLDGHGDRVFRRELLAYLRRSLNDVDKKMIKNLRFRDSGRDVLIQLADMVAGSINRTSQKDKTDQNDYWNVIKSKSENLWRFK